MDIKVSNTEKSKNNLEKHMKGGPLTLLYNFVTNNAITLYYTKKKALRIVLRKMKKNHKFFLFMEIGGPLPPSPYYD